MNGEAPLQGREKTRGKVLTGQGICTNGRLHPISLLHFSPTGHAGDACFHIFRQIFSRQLLCARAWLTPAGLVPTLTEERLTRKLGHQNTKRGPLNPVGQGKLLPQGAIFTEASDEEE